VIEEGDIQNDGQYKTRDREPEKCSVDNQLRNPFFQGVPLIV
jgi:hypothetical protein